MTQARTHLHQAAWLWLTISYISCRAVNLFQDMGVALCFFCSETRCEAPIADRDSRQRSQPEDSNASQVSAAAVQQVRHQPTRFGN